MSGACVHAKRRARSREPGANPASKWYDLIMKKIVKSHPLGSRWMVRCSAVQEGEIPALVEGYRLVKGKIRILVRYLHDPMGLDREITGTLKKKQLYARW